MAHGERQVAYGIWILECKWEARLSVAIERGGKGVSVWRGKAEHHSRSWVSRAERRGMDVMHGKVKLQRQSTGRTS